MVQKRGVLAWILVFAMIFQIGVTAFADELPNNLEVPQSVAIQEQPNIKEQSIPETPITTEPPGTAEEMEDSTLNENVDIEGSGLAEKEDVTKDTDISNNAADIEPVQPPEQPPAPSVEQPPEPTPPSSPIPEEDLGQNTVPSVPDVVEEEQKPVESPKIEPIVPPLPPKVDVTTLFGQELLMAVRELGDEEYADTFKKLSKEQRESLYPLFVETDLIRMQQFFENVNMVPIDAAGVSYFPATNTQVGNILIPELLAEPPAGFPVKMMRSMSFTSQYNESSSDAIRLSKTATRVEGSSNEDPLYRIDLMVESASNIIGETIPCDIALVLDCSGSMNDYGFVLEGEPLTSRTYLMEVNGYYYVIAYSQSSKTWIARWVINYGDGSEPIERWTPVDITGKILYTKRIDVLKDAVAAFVDSVKEHSSKSQIAVVSYGDNAHLEINLTPVSQAETIKDKVDRLRPRGATATDKGMGLVKKEIFYKPAEQERARVVVMFTDGVPTTYREFDTEVANRTIKTSDTLKSSEYNCTIYTIGVFEQEDFTPEGLKQVENFMKSVATPSHNDKQYYLKADSVELLNDIFAEISTETGVTIRNMNVKDYLDPRFQYYQTGDNAATSIQGGELIWTNVTVLPGIENAFKASFLVKPQSDFIGGFVVPTNIVGPSGLYSASNVLVDSFPQCEVMVPVRFALNEIADDYILHGEYIPKTAEEVERMLYVFDTKGYEYPDGYRFDYEWTQPLVQNTQIDSVTSYTVKVVCKPTGDSASGVSKTGYYTVHPVKPIFLGTTSEIFLGETIAQGTGIADGKDLIKMSIPKVDVAGKDVPEGAITQLHEENYKQALTYEYTPNFGIDDQPTEDTNYGVTAKHGTKIIETNIPVTTKVISGSLTIHKTGAVDADQPFVFEIKQSGASGGKENTFYRVIHGTGTVTISNLPKGRYTVTELTDWSWRYQVQEENGISVQIGKPTQSKCIEGKPQKDQTVSFENKKVIHHWFSSVSSVTNRFLKKGGNAT